MHLHEDQNVVKESFQHRLISRVKEGTSLTKEDVSALTLSVPSTLQSQKYFKEYSLKYHM